MIGATKTYVPYVNIAVEAALDRMCQDIRTMAIYDRCPVSFRSAKIIDKMPISMARQKLSISNTIAGSLYAPAGKAVTHAALLDSSGVIVMSAPLPEGDTNEHATNVVCNIGSVSYSFDPAQVVQ